MTESTKTVFEKYQVRKTKKQKRAFIEYVKQIAESNGYSFKIEKGLGARNIVVGDVKQADVVYTAHYDTCAKLPFPNFITPKNFLIYLLYQLGLGGLIGIAAVLVGALLGIILSVIAAVITALSSSEMPAHMFLMASMYIVLFALLFLMLAGPANKNTANDNTSGVTTLLDIMNELPAEKHEKVAFVFFDLEEAGLIGSSAFALKNNKAMKQKLLLNFDCVSDGNNMIFAVRKKAKRYVPMLKEAFKSTEDFNVEVLTKGIFYPSDQVNFPLGVGVAALKKSKKFNILYMNRIHTKRDVIYREENIEFLKNGSIKLLEFFD